jgi:hypothetical protein
MYLSKLSGSLSPKKCFENSLPPPLIPTRSKVTDCTPTNPKTLLLNKLLRSSTTLGKLKNFHLIRGIHLIYLEKKKKNQ